MVQLPIEERRRGEGEEEPHNWEASWTAKEKSAGNAEQSQVQSQANEHPCDEVVAHVEWPEHPSERAIGEDQVPSEAKAFGGE